MTKTVWVCEGERKAKTCWALGIVATCWAHGCKSVHKTDWTPLAACDVVIVWPDYDAGGIRAALQIAEILCKLNPKLVIKIVHPGLLKLGLAEDVVDLVKQIEGEKGSGGDGEKRPTNSPPIKSPPLRVSPSPVLSFRRGFMTVYEVFQDQLKKMCTRPGILAKTLRVTETWNEYTDAKGLPVMVIARIEFQEIKKGHVKNKKEFRPAHPEHGKWYAGDPPAELRGEFHGKLPLFGLARLLKELTA